MKKLLLCLSFLAVASVSHADILADGSNVFNSDSGQVSVTTSSVKQVMTSDNFITKSYLINPSSWTDVCISTVSASVAVASTSWVSIPPSTVFSMDGPNAPWWGPLWAIICNGPGQSVASSQTISIMRTK